MMRNLLLAVAVVGGLATMSYASIELQDDFSNDGALVGSTPDVGGSIWDAHSGAGAKPIQVVSGEAVVVESSGSGEDDSAHFLNGAVTAGQTLTADFDVTITSQGDPVTPLYFAHFRNETTFFGARIWITTPVTSGFGLGFSNGGSIDATWPSDLAFGTTYHITTSYDFDSGDTYLSVDGGTPIYSAGFAGDAFSNYAFRQNTGGNSTMYIDNLVVTKVPEPATLALLGLGGLMIVSRRRSA
jgi:PEP-CTERM motif